MGSGLVSNIDSDMNMTGISFIPLVLAAVSMM